MNNKTRLEKLKQAEALIREVEFSYPQGHTTRQRLYRAVVNMFGMFGDVYYASQWIKDDMKKWK